MQDKHITRGSFVTFIICTITFIVELYYIPDYDDRHLFQWILLATAIVGLVSLGILINSYLHGYATPVVPTKNNSNDLNDRLLEKLNIEIDSQSDIESVPQYVKSIYENFHKSVNINLETFPIISDLYRLEGKLKKEVERLQRNANLNLIIGSLTTLVSIILLWSSISDILRDREIYPDDDVAYYDMPKSQNNQKNSDIVKRSELIELSNKINKVDNKLTKLEQANLENIKDKIASFTMRYVPRLSTIIFVEIFAFFFLRLYRKNLDEIKFFQNESTNVLFKLTALKASVIRQNKASESDIINEFSKTERNFVLKKGETTERLELEKNQEKTNFDIIEKLAKIIREK